MTPRVAFIGVLVIACAVLVLHWGGAQLVCGWDTSYCADGREKDTLYQGTLTRADGTAVANTAFTVAFESRARERRVGGFSTDAAGRYCVRWAAEPVVPQAYVGDTPVGRLESPDAPDPALECEEGDAGVPWNRSGDVTSTLEYRSLLGAGALAVAVLVVGLFRPLQPVFYAGATLTAASVGAFLMLWVI